MSPLLTTMFLMGSAVVLAAGFYFARGLATGSGDDPPEIGIWSDDANDRLLVVLGDEEADWSDVEVRTSVPTRVRLDGQADGMQGTLSPGAVYVPMTLGSQGVVGGDEVSLCTIGAGRAVDVSLRDGKSNTVIFERTMSVQRCASA